eukprot:5416246-Karenia_brevis.AAC.1
MTAFSAEFSTVQTCLADVSQRLDALTKGFISMGDAVKSTAAVMVTQGQQNLEHLIDGNKVMVS